ncbi:hypothetical protein [Chryseobacterium aquaticum]|uniref:hypothetical protein n=1 Tax=Chryseobacterium aquaticum TaxID=452084 RepID=UPI000AC0FA9A|nr:hypothetical protein [Chryseobacterium aquaticum]
MREIYPLIIVLILGLIAGSIITYYVVRASVKDAMKQSEYYLEIIAKNAIKKD